MKRRNWWYNPYPSYSEQWWVQYQENKVIHAALQIEWAEDAEREAKRVKKSQQEGYVTERTFLYLKSRFVCNCDASHS